MANKKFHILHFAAKIKKVVTSDIIVGYFFLHQGLKKDKKKSNKLQYWHNIFFYLLLFVLSKYYH